MNSDGGKVVNFDEPAWNVFFSNSADTIDKDDLDRMCGIYNDLSAMYQNNVIVFNHKKVHSQTRCVHIQIVSEPWTHRVARGLQDLKPHTLSLPSLVCRLSLRRYARWRRSSAR